MKREKKNDRSRALSASFITGAIALVFLIVGYQIAVFMNRAAEAKAERRAAEAAAAEAMAEPKAAGQAADNEAGGAPFTEALPAGQESRRGTTSGTGSANHAGNSWERNNSGTTSGSGRGVTSGSGRGMTSGSSRGMTSGSGQEAATGTGRAVRAGTGEREKPGRRAAENFEFDPNTVSVEDLQRLGFSEKQAQSIENYRNKGGKFRRKTDFARSFVVSDSVYRRLEPYIMIPKIELNAADSAALVSLPGIGGYFARKIIEYRTQLGGYSFIEQLMDIYRFDSGKFDGLKDLICIDTAAVRPYPLWTLPEDSLSLHPYIGTYAAHGIAVYRENNPREDWTVEALDKAGILRPGMAEKLSRCRIAGKNPE